MKHLINGSSSTFPFSSPFFSSFFILSSSSLLPFSPFLPFLLSFLLFYLPYSFYFYLSVVVVVVLFLWGISDVWEVSLGYSPNQTSVSLLLKMKFLVPQFSNICQLVRNSENESPPRSILWRHLTNFSGDPNNALHLRSTVVLWVSGWLLWPVILISLIFCFRTDSFHWHSQTNQRKMEMTMIKIASRITFFH